MPKYINLDISKRKRVEFYRGSLLSQLITHPVGGDSVQLNEAVNSDLVVNLKTATIKPQLLGFAPTLKFSLYLLLAIVILYLSGRSALA